MRFEIVIDAGFAQIKNDMVGMQQKGIQAAIEYVEIHPGLARFLREKGKWDPKWDAKIAKPQ